MSWSKSEAEKPDKNIDGKYTCMIHVCVVN